MPNLTKPHSEMNVLFLKNFLPESACPGWPGEVLRVRECHTAELSPLLSTSPKCGFDEENDGV